MSWYVKKKRAYWSGGEYHDPEYGFIDELMSTLFDDGHIGMEGESAEELNDRYRERHGGQSTPAQMGREDQGDFIDDILDWMGF